jgi:hypothetical protein
MGMVVVIIVVVIVLLMMMFGASGARQATAPAGDIGIKG